jgi:hypothetical protein
MTHVGAWRFRTDEWRFGLDESGGKVPWYFELKLIVKGTWTLRLLEKFQVTGAMSTTPSGQAK